MRSRADGQALVELVAIAPIVLLCGLIGLQGLAAGANYVSADNAAHAGALAAQLGSATEPAVAHALPGWSKGRVVVRRSPGRVRVRLRPRAILPPLAALLVVESEARVAK